MLAVGEGDSVKLGTPTVEKAKVLCKIVEQDRDKKIIVFKKKRRQGYKKRQGHRQSYTALQVDKITWALNNFFDRPVPGSLTGFTEELSGT